MIENNPLADWLTRTDVDVLERLLRYRNVEMGGACFPRVETLAGLHPRMGTATVKRATKKFRQRGILKAKRGRFAGSNRYEFDFAPLGFTMADLDADFEAAPSTVGGYSHPASTPPHSDHLDPSLGSPRSLIGITMIHDPEYLSGVCKQEEGDAPAAPPSPASQEVGQGDGAAPARTPSPNLPDLKPAKLTGGADWTPSPEQWQTVCETFSPAYAVEVWRDYAGMTARDAKHRRPRAAAFGHFMALARKDWPAWEEAAKSEAAEAASKHAAELVAELGYSGGRCFGITRGALPTWEAKHPGKNITAEADKFRAAVNDLDRLDLDLHAGFTRWLAGEGNLMLAEWKARAAAVARGAADGLATIRLGLRSRPFRPEEPARVRF